MKTLKSIMIASIVSLTFLGAIVFFLIAITFSNQALVGVYTSDIEKMTKIISEVVSDENSLRQDLIADLSALPSIRDSNTPVIEKQKQLKEIALKDDNFLDIYVVDLYGMTTDVDGNDKFLATRQDFIQAREGVASVFGPTYDAEYGSLVFYYSVPVYDENNELSSVMCLISDGKMLSEICSHYVIGDSTHPIILERSVVDIYGDVDHDRVLKRINLRDEAKKQKNDAFVEALNAMAKNESGVLTYTDKKETYFFSFDAVKGSTWSVAASVPKKELINKILGMRVIMSIAAIVLLIFGFLVAFMLTKAINPLKLVGNKLIAIGSGHADLTNRLKLKRVTKEIGNVVVGFNSFVEKLQEIVQKINQSEETLSEVNLELQQCAEETSSSISQIMGNILSVTSEIGNESHSVSETAGAVQQIASNINSLEHMIAMQAENVEEATAAVEEMVGNINSVNNSVTAMVQAFDLLEENAKIGIQTQNNVNERLQKIDEESKMLQEANAVISAIAEQTNLLAMNAAIEAAHAGEAGRGFSVVADEIRKLSENSSSQSETIGQELSSIQASINYVVSESNKASEAFTSVAENIKKTDEVIQMIKGAMDEQQVGSKQITESLYAMNNSTLEVRQAAREMSLGNEQILNEVQTLQNATNIVNSSIHEMDEGAKSINEAGSKLLSIAQEVSSSVETIHTEIGQFKV